MKTSSQIIPLTTVVTITLVALTLVVAGLRYAELSTIQQTEQEEVVWDTYINASHRYQIAVPKGWTQIEAGKLETIPITSYPDTLVDDELHKVSFTDPDEPAYSTLYVIVRDNPDQLPLTAWLEKLKSTPNEDGTTLDDVLRSERSVVVADTEAVELTIFAFDSLTTRIIMEHGSTIVELQYPSVAPSDPQEAEHQELFTYMVDSFAFAVDDTLDTSTWETYTDVTYAYSLSYPSDWYASEAEFDGFNVVGKQLVLNNFDPETAPGRELAGDEVKYVLAIHPNLEGRTAKEYVSWLKTQSVLGAITSEEERKVAGFDAYRVQSEGLGVSVQTFISAAGWVYSFTGYNNFNMYDEVLSTIRLTPEPV